MLKIIETGDPVILRILAEGTVTQDDYEKILIPRLEQLVQAKKKVRCLIETGEDFQGYTPGAAWDDFLVGIKFYSLFIKCAVVSDVDWIRHASHFFGLFLPCPVKVFHNNEINSALKWISTDS